MALFQVQEVDGQKQLVPLSGGVPDGSVGSLIMKYKKIQPKNCLYCDGRDTTGTDEELRIHYPALYMYLGSNVLPDYRECVMVGAEQNTTDAITTHDVFTQGQFKDDALKTHGGHLPQGSWSGRGSYYMDSAKCMGNFSSGAYGWQIESGNEMRPVRIEVGDSSVTRTKQKAVYVYIVAVDSVVVSDDESFLHVVQDFVETKIGNAEDYTTEERDTGGKWLDGKKIYRRVLTGTWDSGTSFNVSFPKATYNVDRFVDIRLGVDDGNGMVFEYYYTSTDYLNLYYDNNNGYFVLRRGTYPRVPNTYYVVLKYTKTTD